MDKDHPDNSTCTPVQPEEDSHTSVGEFQCTCGNSTFEVLMPMEPKECGAPDIVCTKCHVGICVHVLLECTQEDVLKEAFDSQDGSEFGGN